MQQGRRVTTVCLAALAALVLASGCLPAARALSPRQVLSRAVDNLVALNSYRYRGTSSIKVAGDRRLDSTSRFDTALARNGTGGLDGHMVVTSTGYSYETYSYRGWEYTRLKGAGWTRTARGTTDAGYGMVSAGARKIIARFADLVDDVKVESVTPGSYTISMSMGDRYYQGAAAIAGAPAGGAGVARDTEMILTISSKDFTMTGVVMKDARVHSGSTPAVSIVTRGSYSELNRPASVEPPAEALQAPVVSPADAPPVRQPQ